MKISLSCSLELLHKEYHRELTKLKLRPSSYQIEGNVLPVLRTHEHETWKNNGLNIDRYKTFLLTSGKKKYWRKIFKSFLGFVFGSKLPLLLRLLRQMHCTMKSFVFMPRSEHCIRIFGSASCWDPLKLRGKKYLAPFSNPHCCVLQRVKVWEDQAQTAIGLLV